MTRLVLEVSQAKSDRPIKTLENTNPLAFTVPPCSEIETEPADRKDDLAHRALL